MIGYEHYISSIHNIQINQKENKNKNNNNKPKKTTKTVSAKKLIK